MAGVKKELKQYRGKWSQVRKTTIKSKVFLLYVRCQTKVIMP